MNPLDLLGPLNGYKTYIVGVATVAYGVYQFYTGNVAAAPVTILTGLGMLFGRHAVAKVEALAK